MKFLVFAATIASMVSAANETTTSTCTAAELTALTSTTSPNQCMATKVGPITVVDLGGVNLNNVKSKSEEEIIAAIMQNKTSNLTDALNYVPAFVAAIEAAFNTTGLPDYDGFDNDFGNITNYNNIYRAVACPAARKLLDTMTTCISKGCNETVWGFCANQTDGLVGLTTDFAKQTIGLSALLRISCLDDTNDATVMAKCKTLFPANLFGTYVAPTAAPTTAGSAGDNTTSASSSVEIAVLAAASLVATTVLAF